MPKPTPSMRATSRLLRMRCTRRVDTLRPPEESLALVTLEVAPGQAPGVRSIEYLTGALVAPHVGDAVDVTILVRPTDDTPEPPTIEMRCRVVEALDA